MSEHPSTTIVEHFSDLKDPRIERARLHPLVNVLTIALCGAISGADSWVDIALFGECQATTSFTRQRQLEMSMAKSHDLERNTR